MATAQQIFRDLENGIRKPFYLIVGEEPFQAAEICSRIYSFFIKDENEKDFSFESWDGEGLSGNRLLSSLDMLPGLFSGPDSIRLIRCDKFEKVLTAELEVLERYFENPSESTVFLILASKIDKRKSWVKQVTEKGYVVEVDEPYDRDWPKWLPYFEKKAGKRIQADAWEWIVESAGRKLSLVWQEVDRASLYVGDSNVITRRDVEALVSNASGSDIFQFAEDVIGKKKFQVLRSYEALKRSGESEIKILSILVRQFRMLDLCKRLMKQGVQDPKALAPKLGTHPFFVPKLQELAKKQSTEALGQALTRLSDCDYLMKTSGIDLFEGFLSEHLH